jgi:protease I
MEKEMQGKTARILIVVRDGSSGGHLDYGRFRMMEEGYDLTVAAPAKKPLQTVVHYPQAIVEYPKEGTVFSYYERPGYVVQADAAFDDIDPTTYDGLLIPGGRGPEYLQTNKRCLEIVRYFVDSGKPIGAICHGPLLLVAAGVTGRRMSCVEQIETDVIASGNTLVNVTDEAVFDGNIVTAFRIPYAYYAWIRGFLDLMQQHGFQRREPAQPKGARILMVAGDYAASAQLQYAQYRMLEELIEANKPIASICRGPSLLLAAGVRGKRMTAIDVIRRDITMSGNTYVEAEGAAVVEGNIATVSSRPYYHLWMQAFLSMLEERAAKAPSAAGERAKALAMA